MNLKKNARKLPNIDFEKNPLSNCRDIKKTKSKHLQNSVKI